MDLIRSLFWYKSTHRYYVDSLYGGTRRYYWTYTYFTYTEVPVDTTEILHNVYWYCGTYSYTGVLVSTTELSLSEAYTEVPVGSIEILLIQI